MGKWEDKQMKWGCKVNLGSDYIEPDCPKQCNWTFSVAALKKGMKHMKLILITYLGQYFQNIILTGNDYRNINI